MSISDVLKTKLFWGATTISFFLECRLVWWAWIFLLLQPFVVEDTFGTEKYNLGTFLLLTFLQCQAPV